MDNMSFETLRAFFEFSWPLFLFSGVVYILVLIYKAKRDYWDDMAQAKMSSVTRINPWIGSILIAIANLIAFEFLTYNNVANVVIIVLAIILTLGIGYLLLLPKNRRR